MAGKARLDGDRRRGLPNGNRGPPPAIRPCFRKLREIRRLDPFMLEEDELAPWFQDSFDTAQGLHDTGNGAEREGAHDGIDRIVVQRDAFARKTQELNVEASAAPLPLGQ